MDILVIVGQVPATDVEIQYDRWLNGVDPDDILYTTSRHDLQAVDEAIRIRDSNESCTVTLIGVGPPGLENVLRAYLSLGADEAIQVCYPEIDGSDVYQLSLALSQVINQMKYDLVLCGAESVDDYGCSFFPGPYLAEVLGLPQVSGVTRIESIDGQGLVVHRKLDKGDRQVLRCPLPCLLTIETGTKEPGYPSFPNSLSGITKKIQKLEDRPLESSQHDSSTRITGFTPLCARVKKGLVIDTRLSAAERMKMMMTGGQSTKNGDQKLLTGEPGKLAENIVSILESQRIIRKVA